MDIALTVSVITICITINSIHKRSKRAECLKAAIENGIAKIEIPF